MMRQASASEWSLASGRLDREAAQPSRASARPVVNQEVVVGKLVFIIQFTNPQKLSKVKWNPLAPGPGNSHPSLKQLAWDFSPTPCREPQSRRRLINVS